MNKYELVVVVDGMLGQEDKESILREATEGVSKGEGKIINSQLWLDKHKMSFPMRKSSHGTYYLINFESPAASVAKVKQNLTLNERILRFLIINTDK